MPVGKYSCISELFAITKLDKIMKPIIKMIMFPIILIVHTMENQFFTLEFYSDDLVCSSLKIKAKQICKKGF